MIITNCCYCDNPIMVDYDCTDVKHGDFMDHYCVMCNGKNIIELTSINGTTYSIEDFTKLFIDTGKVGNKHR